MSLDKKLMNYLIKIIKACLREMLILCIKAICAISRREQKSLDINKNIKLLYYIDTGLGNFIYYTAALKSLKREMPNSYFIAIVLNKTGADEIAEIEGLYDLSLDATRKTSIFHRLKIAFYIRKLNIDVTINEFHNNSYIAIIYTLISKAKTRVGHISSIDWINRFNFVYNIQVPLESGVHEIELYYRLLDALLKKNVPRNLPQLNLNKLEKFQFSDISYEFGLTPHMKLVGIHFGVSKTFFWKQWPLENFSKLIEMILADINTAIVLIGVMSEKKQELELLKAVSSEKRCRVFSVVGKTNISESISVLKSLKCLIGNDSGIEKVGPALGVPTITLWGAADYSRVGAWSPNYDYIIKKNYECMPCFKIGSFDSVLNCPHKYRCINDISVEEVYSKLISLINV